MQVFINEAFSKAIKDYLKSVEQPKGVLYNSFLVVVIRLLIIMYSELDIVNPMVINDEDLLKNNLAKYGYSKNDLDMFFSDLQVSYNFLMADDVLEIDNYFKKQMKENVKVVVPREKHLLNVKAYELLNYSMDQINNMDASEVDRVNHQVYDYFKIRENAINKEYLLDKAVEAIEREQNKVTSGNGYVDILLVMSIICTVIMVVGIITFIVI